MLKESFSAPEETSAMPCGMLGSLRRLKVLIATMSMVAGRPL